MPYTKNVWVDDSVPDIDAANLNHMEAGIAAAPYGPDTTGHAGWVPVADGSGGWVYQTISTTAGTSGTLASRPTAAAGSGLFYYATDQVALYFSDGSTWRRCGDPAGATMLWYSATAPTGWVLYDGSTLAGSTGIYADLYAHLGNTTTLPDTRGRMPVGLGTHADNNAVGKNEGVATAANRRAAHRTSNALGGGTTGNQSADHTHSGTTGNDSPDHTHFEYSSLPGGGNTGIAGATGAIVNSQQGDAGPQTGGASARHTHSFTSGGVSANHTHTTPAPSGSIGTNVGTDPLDQPAFIVMALAAKL